MAHLVRLGALTEELISSLTPFSAQTSSQKSRSNKDTALRSLRSQNYLRTNDFEVYSQLDGLEEKFRVLNEDTLADILRKRLNELQRSSNRWTPEVLHFLLLLSDQPAKKVKLADLEFLRPPAIIEVPALQWTDLVADDPALHDTAIWSNIDYTGTASEDDYISEDNDSVHASTVTTIEEDSAVSLLHFALEPDLVALQKHNAEQYWNRAAIRPADKFQLFAEDTVHISELQVIREVLFLLRGLPSVLFTQTDSTTQVKPAYRILGCSGVVSNNILSKLALKADMLCFLRDWVSTAPATQLLQRLQGQISYLVQELDSFLTDLAGKMIDPVGNIFVSLLALRVELDTILQPLLRAATIITAIQQSPRSDSHNCLELLFDGICTAQAAGEDQIYAVLGKLFFGCLNAYLRPVHTWMATGEVDTNNNTFFVMDIDHDVDLALVWTDRFRLRHASDGRVDAPHFLTEFVARILNTGKSVVVLNTLGKLSLSPPAPNIENTSLDIDLLCSAAEYAFMPFPQLLRAGIQDWMESRTQRVSSVLSRRLLHHCGLYTSISAVQDIYFLKDGSAATLLAESIFSNLDASDLRWDDRYILTQTLQSTVGQSTSVVTENLSASAINLSPVGSVEPAHSSVRSLEAIVVHYRLPWPVRIVITREAMLTFQSVLVFLLQLRRSLHLLYAHTSNKSNGEDGFPGESATYYSLRAALLWFTSIVYNHLTTVVLQSNSEQLERTLSMVSDVDDMITTFAAFVRRIRDQALLAGRLKPIREAIINVLDISIKMAASYQAHVYAQERRNNTVHDSCTSRHKPSHSAPLSVSRASTRSDDLDADAPNPRKDLLPHVLVANDSLTYADQLRKLKHEFKNLLRFVTHGLRSVGRSGGGEKSWETLADSLEAGLPHESWDDGRGFVA